MKKTKQQNKKSTKRRAYESLILLLLTICLFVSATFAWFTDSAFSKGNKVFAGNLYVDVVATLDQMVERYNIDHVGNEINPSSTTKAEAIEKINDAYPDLELHDRKYKNPLYAEYQEDPSGFVEAPEEYSHDYYYIITDQDLAVMNIYNMEPGQVRRAEINYLNTGDLAFSAAGAIKIDVETGIDGNIIIDEATNEPVYKSYTGLENLNKQFYEGEDVFKNNYVVGEDDDGNPIIDPFKIFKSNNKSTTNRGLLYSKHDKTSNNKPYSIYKGFGYPYVDKASAKAAYDEYEYRFNKLLNLQAKEVESGGNIDKYTFTNKAEDPFYEIGSTTLTNYENIGLHLEDILEVYIANDSSSNQTAKNAEIKEEGSLTPAPSTAKNISTRESILDKNNFFGTVRQFNHLMQFGYSANKDFDYTIYSKDSSSSDFVLLKAGQVVNRVNCLPEEEYMYLYEDPEAKLYADYNKYLGLAGNYCLPRDVLKDSNGCYPYNINSDNVDPRKVQVNVYGGGVEEDDTYYANELGSTSIAIYMPENADSRYQNASISLSYGVTATQVEYEMDDTGCMIYDKYKKNVEVGDVLLFNSSSLDDNGLTVKIPLRAIKVDGSKVTFMVLRDFASLVFSLGEVFNDDNELTSDSEIQAMIMMYNSYYNLIGELSESESELNIVPSSAYVDSNNNYFTDGLDYKNSAIDIFRCFGELLLFGSSDSLNAIYEQFQNLSGDDEDDGPSYIDDLMSELPESLKNGALPQFYNSLISKSFNQYGYVLAKTNQNSLYSLGNSTYFSNPYYSANHDEVEDTYSRKTTDSKVRLLTLKDIYDFYGKDTLTNEEVARFMYGKDDAYEDAPSVWLADAGLTPPSLKASITPEEEEMIEHLSKLQSLVVNPDGTITSQQVMNFNKTSDFPYVSNETRYVFTVNMSKVNGNDFVKVSNELEDVDLSYDSSIWGDIKPVKPMPIDDGFPDEEFRYSKTNVESGNVSITLPNQINAVDIKEFTIDFDDEDSEQYFELKGNVISVSTDTPLGNYHLSITAFDSENKVYYANYSIEIIDSVVPEPGDLLVNLNYFNTDGLRVLSVDNENDTATIFFPVVMNGNIIYFDGDDSRDTHRSPVATKNINGKYIADYYNSYVAKFEFFRGQSALAEIFGEETFGSDPTHYEHIHNMKNSIRCYNMQQYVPNNNIDLNENDILYKCEGKNFIFKYQFDEPTTTDLLVRPLSIKDIYDSYYDQPGKTLTNDQVANFIKNTFDYFGHPEDTSFWLMDLCASDVEDNLNGYYFTIDGMINSDPIVNDGVETEYAHSTGVVVTIDLEILDKIDALEIPEHSNINDGAYVLDKTRYALLSNLSRQFYSNIFSNFDLNDIKTYISIRDLTYNLDADDFINDSNYFNYFSREIEDASQSDEILLELKGASKKLVQDFNTYASNKGLHLIYVGTLSDNTALEAIGNNSFYGNTLSAYIQTISQTISDFCNDGTNTINDNNLNILIQDVYGATNQKWFNFLNDLQSEINKMTFKHKGENVNVTLHADKLYDNREFYTYDENDKTLLKNIDLIIQFDKQYFYDENGYYESSLEIIDELYGEGCLNTQIPPIIFVNLFDYNNSFYPLNSNIYKVIEGNLNQIFTDVGSEMKDNFDSGDHSSIKKNNYSIIAKSLPTN